MKLFLLLVLLSPFVFGEVVDLTHDNFDTIVTGDKPALIEFYAPWCGHCVKLEPEYNIVGEKFPSTGDVLIARVNADQHRELGSRFGIRGFPTLKWFPKNDLANVEDYKGGRSAQAIIDFVNVKTGKAAPAAPAAPAASDSGAAFTAGQVLVLTPANFDTYVKDNGDKHVFVDFYAPWCGHCKNLEPTWNQLAGLFAPTPDVIIAKVDASEHRDIGGRFGVRGFPTLKLFKAGGQVASPTDYNGGRTIDNLANWLSSQTNIAPGALNKNNNAAPAAADAAAAAAAPAAAGGEAGAALQVLTPENFDTVINGKRSALVAFTAPWCGHCVRLHPELSAAADTLSKEERVYLAKVDADAHRDLGARFNIRGYPTLFWFPKGGDLANPVAYTGGRTQDAITKWVLEKLEEESRAAAVKSGGGWESKTAKGSLGILQLAYPGDLDALIAKLSKTTSLIVYYGDKEAPAAFVDAYWRLGSSSVKFAHMAGSSGLAGIEIRGYRNGVWLDSRRPKELRHILSFVLSVGSTKGVVELDTIAQTSNFLEKHDAINMLGVFVRGGEEEEAQVARFKRLAASFAFDMPVGLVRREEVAMQFGIKEDDPLEDQSLIINKQRWSQAAAWSEFTALDTRPGDHSAGDDAATLWISENGWRNIAEFTKESYARLNTFQEAVFLMFVDYVTEHQTADLEALHREFHDKGIGFLWGDAKKWHGFYKHLGLSNATLPAIAIADVPKKTVYHFPKSQTPNFSLHAYRQFVQSYVDGIAVPYEKSAPEPQGQEGALIKEVVASSWDREVFGAGKDVVVMFYLPWCPHCKKFAPVYNRIASLVASVPSLAFVKMDIDANDPKKQFEVSSGPTLMIFPSDKARKAIIKFEGPSHDEESVLKWALKHATTKFSLPENFEDPEKVEQEKREAELKVKQITSTLRDRVAKAVRPQ